MAATEEPPVADVEGIQLPERRKNTLRPTISQILSNMQSVADLDFRGDLENNAIIIFDHLSEGDRRTFMRHSLKLLWERQIDLTQRGIRDIMIDDVVFDLQAIASERNYIENQNEEGLDRLKVTIARITYATAAIALIMTFVITFFYDPSGQNVDAFVKVLNFFAGFL